MGPYSELRQLERREQVLRLLEREDLSPWARNYWGTVLARLATSESRYNARVVALYTEMRNQTPREWW
jgi:hypothetical protein